MQSASSDVFGVHVTIMCVYVHSCFQGGRFGAKVAMQGFSWSKMGKACVACTRFVYYRLIAYNYGQTNALGSSGGYISHDRDGAHYKEIPLLLE